MGEQTIPRPRAASALPGVRAAGQPSPQRNELAAAMTAGSKTRACGAGNELEVEPPAAQARPRQSAVAARAPVASVRNARNHENGAPTSA